MFKHYSVKKKMTIGYGIIIGLLVLVVLLAAFSSIQQASGLARIERMSRLQDQIVGQMQLFNEARLDADTVILEIDDEVYNRYIASTNTILETNSLIRQQIGEIDLDVKVIDLLSASTQEWVKHIKGVQSYNIILTNQTEVVLNSAAELSQLAHSAFLTCLETGNRQIIMDAAAFSKQAEVIRADSGEAILIYETTDMSAVYAQFDAAAALLDGLPADVVAPLQEALERYRAETVSFATSSEDSTLYHETNAYELAESISTQFASLSLAVQDAVTALVEAAVIEARIAIFVTFATAFVAIVFGILVASRITKGLTIPLVRMKALVNRISDTGDMHFTDEERERIAKDAAIQDEVGQSVLAISKLLERLEEISDCMQQIAAQDLTAEIEPLSENDGIGNSLQTMCKSLNDVFAKIVQASKTVASGADLLSDNAQTLAQETTEQSTSMQELSMSISEIDHQARYAAKSADEAVSVGESAQEATLQGVDNMAAMVTSVQQINLASKNVQQVIKSIEDIAFQTNILALNAAVEAARAGQHGKGFAVVADEVRNLATKSSDASKETAELLSSIIVIAGESMELTEKASDSFTQIQESIESTTTYMRDISSRITKQSEHLQRISGGMETVVHGIQTSSASSQTTAATSEEMSSQAAFLRQLVSAFRLRKIVIPFPKKAVNS